jgi:hypothetical protein
MYDFNLNRILPADIEDAQPTPNRIDEFQPDYIRWQSFSVKDVYFKYET